MFKNEMTDPQEASERLLQSDGVASNEPSLDGTADPQAMQTSAPESEEDPSLSSAPAAPTTSEELSPAAAPTMAAAAPTAADSAPSSSSSSDFAPVASAPTADFDPTVSAPSSSDFAPVASAPTVGYSPTVSAPTTTVVYAPTAYAPSSEFASPVAGGSLSPPSTMFSQDMEEIDTFLLNPFHLIVIAVIVGVVTVLFFWKCCKSWKLRREKQMLRLQSTRVDAVLGDMQMVGMDDYDGDDPELI